MSVGGVLSNLALLTLPWRPSTLQLQSSKGGGMTQEFFVGSGSGAFSESVITLYCDNSGAIANSKEPRSHKRGKHIERKYHLLREIVHRGDTVVSQIVSEDNLADPFMKGLAQKIFDQHEEEMGVRCIAAWL